MKPSKLRARRLREQERAEARVRTRPPRPIDERLLRDIKLPTRVVNVLRGEGVHTIGDLTWMTETQLLRLPHVGRITLWDIQQALEMMGLSLRRDPNRKGKRTLAIPRSWAVTVRNQVRVRRAAEHKAAKEAAASNRRRVRGAREATRAAAARERVQRRERAMAVRKATIWARLQEGATSQEVAAEFGITPVRVNQVRREMDRQRGLPKREERYRDRIGAITKLARTGKRESEIITELGEPERLVKKVMGRVGIDPWEVRRKRTTMRFAKVRSLREQGVPFKTIAGLLGITIQRACAIDMSERRRLGVVSGPRKPERNSRILALAHEGIGRAEIAREVGATYNIVKLVINRAKRKAVTSAAEGNLIA